MNTIELSAALGQAQVVENLKNFVGVDAQGAAALMTPERLAAVAGGLPYSGYIDKNNFNTSKTPGLYQCGGVTNNDVGINFWGIVLIVKVNDYISQLLIGNVLAWRNLGNDGLTWGKFNIVTARTQ